MPVTTILIVDDHAIVREGLTMVLDLEADLEVVGQASGAMATAWPPPDAWPLGSPVGAMFTRLSRPGRPACPGAVCGPTPPEHDPVGGI